MTGASVDFWTAIRILLLTVTNALASNDSALGVVGLMNVEALNKREAATLLISGNMVVSCLVILKFSCLLLTLHKPKVVPTS